MNRIAHFRGVSRSSYGNHPLASSDEHPSRPRPCQSHRSRDGPSRHFKRLCLGTRVFAAPPRSPTPPARKSAAFCPGANPAGVAALTGRPRAPRFRSVPAPEPPYRSRTRIAHCVTGAPSARPAGAPGTASAECPPRFRLGAYVIPFQLPIHNTGRASLVCSLRLAPPRSDPLDIRFGCRTWAVRCCTHMRASIQRSRPRIAIVARAVPAWRQRSRTGLARR